MMKRANASWYCSIISKNPDPYIFRENKGYCLGLEMGFGNDSKVPKPEIIWSLIQPKSFNFSPDPTLQEIILALKTTEEMFREGNNKNSNSLKNEAAFHLE